MDRINIKLFQFLHFYIQLVTLKRFFIPIVYQCKSLLYYVAFVIINVEFFIGSSVYQITYWLTHYDQIVTTIWRLLTNSLVRHAYMAWEYSKWSQGICRVEDYANSPMADSSNYTCVQVHFILLNSRLDKCIRRLSFKPLKHGRCTVYEIPLKTHSITNIFWAFLWSSGHTTRHIGRAGTMNQSELQSHFPLRAAVKCSFQKS